MRMAVPDQQQRAVAFAGLHAGPDAFVIPNPWDAGTARILTQLGFAALATTSAGVAFSLGRPDDPIYPLEVAVERVTAAVEAARALPWPFTLTARAENFLHGRPDLADTIRRLQAFETAGADVLFAPGLPDLDAIRAVCSSVGRPVNVLVGGSGPMHSVSTLSACGVRRISLGSALPRAALTTVVHAAGEIQDKGTFEFARDALPYGEVNRLMSPDWGIT